MNEKLPFLSFLYPHGHLYLLRFVNAFLEAVGWRFEGTDAILLSRYLNVVLAVPTILATYAIARLLFGVRAGILSAAFIAFAPYHVLYSHLACTDIALALWMTVAFLLAAKASTGAPLATLASAGAAGLAAATKFPGLLSLCPTLWILARAWFEGERDPSPWRQPLVLMLGCGLVCALAFVASTPLTFVNWEETLKALHFANLINVRGGSSVPRPDAGWLSQPYVYQTLAAFPFSMGLPLFALACIGLARMLRRDPRRALIFLAFLAPYFLLVGWARAVYLRYYLPLIPVLCAAAGYAADGILIAPRARKVRAGIVVAIALYTAAVAASASDRFSTNDRSESLRWLAERVRERPGEESTVCMVDAYAAYDGLLKSLRDEPRIRVVFANPNGKNLEKLAPDFVVVSREFEMLSLHRPSRDRLRTWRRLAAGDLGYQLAVEIDRAPSPRDRFYTWLDPMLTSSYANGFVGFRIYERVDLEP